jgi:hypothetical protein
MWLPFPFPTLGTPLTLVVGARFCAVGVLQLPPLLQRPDDPQGSAIGRSGQAAGVAVGEDTQLAAGGVALATRLGGCY